MPPLEQGPDLGPVDLGLARAAPFDPIEPNGIAEVLARQPQLVGQDVLDGYRKIIELGTKPMADDRRWIMQH